MKHGTFPDLQACFQGARILSALMVMAFVSACAPGATLTSGSTADLFDPTDVIALVPDARGAAAVKAGAKAQGFVLVEDLSLRGLDLKMLRFTFPETLDGKGAIAVLEALNGGTTAGINHAYRVSSGTSPNRFDYAANLMQWPRGGCRAQGPVGMIDTGVDMAQLRAAGSRVVSARFERGQPLQARHGTDVAAVLSDPARVSGATIYSAAVVGQSTQGDSMAGVDSIMKALDWLASRNVRLVNISLTGPYNKLLDRSVTTAIGNGMTIVAAVGNDGVTSPAQYPAALDGVIAVTAVDANRRIYRKAIRGSHVDVAAPGVDIPLIMNGKIRFVSGTSMAAPLVTASIASDPGLFGKSPAQVLAGLMQNTEDLGTPGADATFGNGLVLAPATCRP